MLYAMSEHQCKICLGVGLIKRKELKCEHCGSHVSFPLTYTPPYETCEECHGTGTQPAFQKYSTTITQSEILQQQQQQQNTKEQ